MTDQRSENKRAVSGESDAESRRAEILLAVQRYFDAPFRGEDPGKYAVGTLATADALSHAVRIPEAVDRRTFAVKKVEIAHIDGDEATVAFEATSTFTVTHRRFGPVSVNVRFSGPVRLRLVEDAWRIVDYVCQGRSVLASFTTDIVATTEKSGLRATAVAAEFQADASLLYFDVQNLANASFYIDEATLFLPKKRLLARRLRGTVWGETTVEPGRTCIVRADWPIGLSRNASALDVSLVAYSSATRSPVCLDLSVGPAVTAAG